MRDEKGRKTTHTVTGGSNTVMTYSLLLAYFTWSGVYVLGLCPDRSGISKESQKARVAHIQKRMVPHTYTCCTVHNCVCCICDVMDVSMR